MKKRKIQLLLLALLIFYGNLQAQNTCPPYEDSTACELGNGISTDPDNLTNKSCPDLKNDFEWRIKQPTGNTIIEENYTVYDQNGIMRNVRNPFDDNSNSDYRYLALKQNSNYYPDNGWELLMVDFGSLSNIGLPTNADPGLDPATGGTYIPYFILYNKFTGTLRFFGSILGYRKYFATLKVEITIPQSGEFSVPDLKATNLLSIQGNAMQPLDQESDETSISIFCEYPNTGSKFFWFDLPVAYDPCICKEKSELHLTFHQMYSADIPINGDLSRGITNSTAPAKKEFRRSLATASSEEIPFDLNQKIIPANPIINLSSITDWVLLALSSERYSGKERSALAQIFNNIYCTSDFQKVTDRTLAYPDLQEYIRGEKLLDANTSYSSLMSSQCFRTDNAGSLVSDYHFVEGEYTRSDPIFNQQIRLAMPGSDWSETRLQTAVYTLNSKTIPAYPTYNERLGTFSLLETPIFEYEEAKINGSRYLAKLTQSGNFSYSFNPMMNLNLEKTKIHCRLAYSGDVVLEQDNGIHFEHNPEAKYKLTTPFVPIDYFKHMPLVAETYEQLDPKQLFVQFKIYTVSNDLTRDGNPNGSYLFFTFPVALAKDESRVLSSPDDIKQNNFIRMQAKDLIYDRPIVFQESVVLSVDGRVYISADLKVAEGQKVTIYATAGFDIAAGTELSEGLSLIEGYPFKIENQPPVSYEYLNDFCKDKQRYRAYDFSKSIATEDIPLNESQFELYPNPSTGTFFVRLDQPLSSSVQLNVFTASGQLVKSKKLIPYGGLSYTIESSGMTKGIYFVNLAGHNFTQTRRILVQ